jgi:hypothetical protein
MIFENHRNALRRGALALTCAAGLAVLAPAQARHPNLDLDAISQAQFYEMLDDEMDDDDLEACGYGDLEASHPNEVVYAAVICALKDDGDTGEETDLDYDDLQFEMREAGTTVEKVVWAAIQEADRLAQSPLSRSALLAVLRGDVAAVATDSRPWSPEWYAISNGAIDPGPANVRGPVKSGMDRARRAK